MDELNREIADNAKFLAGALARVSPLPEVLLEIILSYVEEWKITLYTVDLAMKPIHEIMPSIEPTHLHRTLNIFSRCNPIVRSMVRVLSIYTMADQIRILDNLSRDDVVRIFHIEDPSIVRQLKWLERFKGKYGKLTLEVLESARD